MEPYFETKLGKLYLGDALEIMKELPDGQFRLIFADYPFKVPGGRKRYFEFVRRTAEQFDRLLADDGWLVVINNPTNLFRSAPYFQGFEFRNEVALIRPHAFHPPGMFGFKHNNMWILAKKKQKLNLDDKIADVMEYQNGYRGKGKAWHPEPVPAWLVEMIVRATTCEGDTILDPFLGSGTTAVVAEKLGRRWLVLK